MDLKGKKCGPCSGSTPPLSNEQKQRLMKEIHPEWALSNDKNRLQRSYRFKNFRKAMEFALKAGELADRENHHPEIHLGWGHCDFEIWTHAIGDLTENDFILAAHIDELTNRP